MKFVDRFTGKTVTVKPILNKSKKVPNVTPKVMGLKLDTSSTQHTLGCIRPRLDLVTEFVHCVSGAGVSLVI